MDERRKVPRKYLVVYSRVFDRKNGKVIGYLSDMSLSGAMIIGDDRLEQGATMQIRIDLPDEPEFPKKRLDLTALVAWSRPDVDPIFFDTGFHFPEVSDEDAKIIETMIEAYEFRRGVPKYPPTVSELEGQES